MGKYSDNITPENYINYLHKFETVNEYEEEKYGFGKPFVSWTVEDDAVNYNKNLADPNMPLTFIIETYKTNQSIGWKSYGGVTKTIEYSKNGGEWISITSASGSSMPSISVENGDIIQFRGNNESYGTSSNGASFCTNSYMPIKVVGNIMSLIDSVNFAQLKEFPVGSSYNFYGLFRDCDYIESAAHLVLPATALTEGCYLSMFAQQQLLRDAPELPATILADKCYYTMFASCHFLKKAPELPATTLANNCYTFMFGECWSLTAAPILPATTLANSCYEQMFYNCSGLTAAPELPATTLAEGCYRYMFQRCSNLNYIKCLATDISATNCTYNWVIGVPSSGGTFVKAAGTTWTTGGNGIPDNWTVQDA